MAQSKYPYHEFSGALQQKTTTHIRKPNEVRKSKNADFATILGAVLRRPGSQADEYDMPKLPSDTPTLGAFIARFPTGTEIWAAQEDETESGDTYPVKLYYWTGPNAEDWEEITSGIDDGAEVHMIDDLDEIWVSSYDPVTDTLGYSFTVDSSHDVSTSRQLGFGPRARFFIEFAGSMWAANVLVNGVRYRDRLYKSSGPTGAVSFVRTAQTDPEPDEVELTNQVPEMTNFSAPAGVAAASSYYQSPADTFAPWRAFSSGLTTTGRWIANSPSNSWLRYDFGAGNEKVITHYSLVGVPTNQAAETDRPPKDWTFEGSQDASSWDVLDTVTNETSWVAGERKTYETTNTTAYRYYRINVSTNNGDPNYIVILSFELLSSLTSTDLVELEVDSARYLKPGMDIDIYEPGTDNKKYDITIVDVDKINDTITFNPETQYFGTSDVNTSTEVITLPDASGFPTGTPIIFESTGAVPTGLTAGTTYYAINVSSTTIKVATTALNASIGNAVNLTATGSGTHRVRLSYIFDNKDEIWKSGRKGELTRFWNLDYRNPEAADWIKLPPTLDGDNDITGVGKISNRLFIFTDNAMVRYDGQNIVPLRNDVGCASHRSIGYYDNFMVWLDRNGKVWIRNDEAGEQDVISEAIVETMALVPQTQLSEASAVVVDDKYKLYLGQVNGKSLRVCYNFRTNQWTEEWHSPKMLVQFVYNYGGNRRPHWFDETGQMWVDEEGDDDNGETIPLEVETGNDNFGVDELKNYHGIKIYSKNAIGTKVLMQVDDGEWKDCGQITKHVDSIRLDRVPKGTLLNIRLVYSIKSKRPQIDKMVVWYTKEEDTFRATRQ